MEIIFTNHLTEKAEKRQISMDVVREWRRGLCK